MRFGQYLLVEGKVDVIKQTANDVIDEFAGEGNWNTDQIVAATLDRMDFIDDAERKAAEDFLYDYLR